MMRKTGWPAWFEVNLTLALLFCFVACGFTGSLERDLKHLERSFSLHASLATFPQNAVWLTNFPSAAVPMESEIRNAARLLVEDYGANRLYLIYHKEIPLLDAERVFQIWREACPVEVEVVPTFQLETVGPHGAEIFSLIELRRLTEFLKKGVNGFRAAVLYTHPLQTEAALKIVSSQFPDGLIRLGVPEREKLEAPFTVAVAETASDLCRGQSNDEWRQSGGGLEQLLKLVAVRNKQPIPVAWDFVVVSCQSAKPISAENS